MYLVYLKHTFYQQFFSPPVHSEKL